jgi:lipopolysaccharide transport system ATP-binding protein
MSDTAIEVESLSKQYRIGEDRARYGSLRESLAKAVSVPLKLVRKRGNTNRRPATIWALNDVSFDVRRGEVVGIIGRNGAGKSTLLKILSRITKPTKGKAIVRGRVGSLLEVGTGFHPELTGFENIYLNGAILGMKRTEIDRKFDEIVEFAEIGQFLDTPAKHYSSGMYMRLAFAVAAHLDSEVLLIDEVLAVGDAKFQNKCLGKMEEVAKGGRTVLFVSHNLAAVENLCNRSILLEDGCLVLDDLTKRVVRSYLQEVHSIIHTVPLIKRIDRRGNGEVKFSSFNVEDPHGNPLNVLQSGLDVVFVFGYTCSPNSLPKNVDVGFGVFSWTGQLLFVIYKSFCGEKFRSIPSNGQFRCLIPRLPLANGKYRVGARITVGSDEADWPQDYIGIINVETGDFFGTGSAGFGSKAPIMVNGAWEIRRTE